MQDACDECDGYWTTKAILEGFLSGKLTMWLLADDETIYAGIGTTIEDWEPRKVAVITVAGGSRVLEAMGEQFKVIEDWARVNGAEEIIMRGRKGFLKPYQRQGFELCAITMRKKLDARRIKADHEVQQHPEPQRLRPRAAGN
jgi:hypothetical protein